MNSIPGNASQQPSGSAQKEDPVDKGLDTAEKKFGGAQGQNSEKNRGVNEKITDGARGMFEKATGKDVPDKISN
ncbi:Nn.00g048700.m01.CDS01 [Neocucurbitaria sp. VM-36]